MRKRAPSSKAISSARDCWWTVMSVGAGIPAVSQMPREACLPARWAAWRSNDGFPRLPPHTMNRLTRHRLAIAATLLGLAASAPALDLSGLSKDVKPCDDFYAF